MTNINFKTLNVLLITMDQCTGTYLSCEGHPVIETSTIDRLKKWHSLYKSLLRMSNLHSGPKNYNDGQTPRLHGDRVFQKSKDAI